MHINVFLLKYIYIVYIYPVFSKSMKYSLSLKISGFSL